MKYKPRPQHTRRDANQKMIVGALRSLGFVVWDLADVGGKVTDLLCCYKGRCIPVEIKTDKGKLTKGQRLSIQELDRVGVRVIVARSLEEILDQWPFYQLPGKEIRRDGKRT